MSVRTLWSKVTVETVDTTPLPNNCQSLAMDLECLSQGPVGLPAITLYKVWAYLSGNFGVVSESQTLPCGPFHPEVSVVAHREMKSALPGLLRLPLSAPRDYLKKTFVVAFDLKEESGPCDGNYGTFFCIC